MRNFVFCCIFLCGCSFMGDRGRDLADVATVGYNIGFGAKARAGPFQTGLGVAVENGMRIPHDILYGVETIGGGDAACDGELIFSGEEMFLDAAKRGKSYYAASLRGSDLGMGSYEASFPQSTVKQFLFYLPFYHVTLPFEYSQEECYSYYTQIEMFAGFPFIFRFGFNPGELVDFIVGWVGIDIYGDDIGHAVSAKFERKELMAQDWKRGGYPYILPSGGTFAAGDTVTVRLYALSNPEMRFTLNGGKSREGKVYTGPFELTETTTVNAGCYNYRPPHFSKQWEEVTDTFTFVEGGRKADQPGRTVPGLLVRIYKDNSLDKLHETSLEPEVTQTVEHFELNVPEGRMKKKDGYVYAGYVEINNAGIWRFYTETVGPSRLYLGERLVVDNHRRRRYDSIRSGSPVLESWGSLHLEPGKHAIRLKYGRPAGGLGWLAWLQESELFEVCYDGPGIDKQPVPADVLSH